MHINDNVSANLSLMRAGLSRRQFLRIACMSGLAVGAGSLLVACDDEDSADDANDADEDEVDDLSDPADDPELDDDSDVEDDEPEAGGQRRQLTVAVQGLPPVLDPYQEFSNVGTRVTYSLFDNLFERDFLDSDPPGTGSTLLPMLASDWERTDDLTLEVRLRDDVLFHNGDGFTADDVKFTFERSFDPPAELADAYGYVSTIQDVEVVDPYTVRFTTGQPDPLLENRLASWGTWILPQDYYESVGLEEFSLNPIGTGPYAFVELRQDELLALEAFDDYWAGLPNATRVEFQVIPETSGRVSAIASGEADIATNIPPDQVDTIGAADGAKIVSVPLANCHVLIYNTYQPELEDKRIRQALNLAIDRELLVETLWDGRAVLMRSHQFEEYGDLFNEERPYTPYDPDQARALLDEAGYNGEEITYSTQAEYYTLGLDAAQAIIEMWADVGINATIVTREDAADAPNDEIMVRNWSNSSFTADPDGAFWLRWGPGTTPQERFWTPENPRFNELGEQARETLDEDFRFDAYQEMLDIWEDEAPGTVLYIPTENYAIRDGVNWTPYSFYYMDLRPRNFSFD